MDLLDPLGQLARLVHGVQLDHRVLLTLAAQVVLLILENLVVLLVL